MCAPIVLKDLRASPIGAHVRSHLMKSSSSLDRSVGPVTPKVLAFAGALAVLSHHAVYAASATWDGSDDVLWANAANWSASPVPGTGDTATFNTATPNQTIDVGTIGIRSIAFAGNAGAYTLGPSVGAGTITLDNLGSITMANTVAADQLINANLVLGPDAGGSTYTLTNSSTTNSLTLAGNITGGAGGTAGTKLLNVSGAGNVSLAGVLTPGGGSLFRLANIGTGVLTLSGSGSQFIGTSNAPGNAGLRATSGTTVLAAGSGITTNHLAVADANGTTGTLKIEGGTLSVTGNFGGVAGAAGASGVTNQTGGQVSIAVFQGVQENVAANSASSGIYNLSGGSLTIGSAGSYRGTFNAGNTFAMNVFGTGTLILSNASNRLSLNGAGSLTISGNGFVEAGPSDLILVNQASTGTGTLNLDGGTLSARGITTSTAAGATSIVNFNGGTFRNNIGATMLSNANVTAYVKAGGAIIDTNGFSTAIFVPLLHDAALGATLDGGLTKNGLGNLNMGLGAIHTYTGATNLNAGTMSIAQSSVDGVGGALGLNSAVTLAAGTSITATGVSVSVGSLAGSGTYAFGGGGPNSLTTGGNNLSTTYSGAITATGSVTKNGTGTQTFSGLNTYSQGTTINAGTLLANTAVGGSNSATGSGAVTVQGTGVLGGIGQIRPMGTNGISVASGASIAPGGVTIGTLVVDLGATTGGITMANDSTFSFRLGVSALTLAAAGGPGSSDMLSITNAAVGDVTFAALGNTVNFLGGEIGYYKLFDTSLANATLAGDTWNNLTYDTTTGLVSGGLSSAGNSFYVGTASNGGNIGDIYVYYAVPEPGTAGLLAMGGCALLFFRRRARC